jgi:hypothetical protein
MTERAGGWTHRFKITNADLTAAATTQTLQLIGTAQNGLAAGDFVRSAAFYLPTAFSGGAATSLTMQVGWDYATGTDVPAGLIAASELLSAARIVAGDATGSAFATLRTGFAAVEGADIEALFTATGANVSTITAGEVWVFLQISKLSSIT